MGRKKHPEQDRNFDDLTQKFQRNIYNTLKGQLRLTILRRDFDNYVASGLNVLDVGAGQGQWALELLRRGHRVMVTDISSEMLAMAEANIRASDLADSIKASVSYHQCALQQLNEKVHQTFDVIICHAVMEWLDQPQDVFAHIEPFVAPGTLLSVIFYNRDGLIFKNLLRANYKKIIARDFRGSRGGLTPLNPLVPKKVQEWAVAAGYETVCHSGIRVFHDYILDTDNQGKNIEQAIQLELEYSQIPPFRDLGRYIHLLLRKT